jgi:hypothetical protein
MKAALLTLMIAGFSSAALAQDAASAPITAHYTCTGGPSLHVVFEDGKATVTPEGGEPIPLTQAMTADGFEYKDATHSLRGRGDDATWTVEGKAIECSAKPAAERG